MYGEPWQGGASMLRRYEANKANLQMLSTRIGVFSDDTRDAIKGNCFDARSPGYVEGKQDAFWDIGSAVGPGASRTGSTRRPQPDHQLCVGPRQPDPVG